MSKEQHDALWSEDSSFNSQRRETVRVYRVQQALHMLVEPEETPEDSHSGLYLRVSGVWQDVLGSEQHEEAYDGAFGRESVYVSVVWQELQLRSEPETTHGRRARRERRKAAKEQEKGPLSVPRMREGLRLLLALLTSPGSNPRSREAVQMPGMRQGVRTRNHSQQAHPDPRETVSVHGVRAKVQFPRPAS